MPGRPGRTTARTQQSGASAVEFALILVPLLTVVFALMQYGFYFWSLQAGAAAAREGVRQAAVGSYDCATFQQFVADRVGSASSGLVTTTRNYYLPNGTTAAAPAVIGGQVKVTVTFHGYDLNFPFVPFVDDAEVTQTARSRVEDVNTSKSVDCS